MSPTLLSIVLYLIDAAKENQTGPVVCCWCNNRVNIIKYGKYQRYGFTSDELIDIQRYLCKHDQCRRTFSILLHPFLRISRFSLCLFNELLRLCDEHTTIAEIARCFAVSWPTIPRSIKMARRIASWLRQEVKTQPVWAPHPCMHPRRSWSEFIRSPLLHRDANDAHLCDVLHILSENSYIHPIDGRHISVSAEAIRKWFYRYNHGGLTALADKQRSDKGQHIVPQALADAMFELRKDHPRWTLALLLRQMIQRNLWDETTPSRSVLYRFARANNLMRDAPLNPAQIDSNTD